MRVYIPADAPAPVEAGFDLETMLDGVRLSELEQLDALLPAGAMAAMLAGEITVPALRPLAWMRLRRDRPDLTIEGFDLEVVEVDADAAEPVAAGKA